MKNNQKCCVFLGLILVISMCISSLAFGATYRLAFLEAEDKMPIEDESEYKWAKANQTTTLIFPSGSGKFKDEKGNAVKLTDFQIVWWHRANAATIPPNFLENSTKNAFLDFVKAGGSLFLSQVALHYVFDLGLESLEPRLCAPNVDHATSGIIAAEGQETHPVFAGFKAMGLDPAKGFNIDCYGHDCMSDFYPKGPAKDGTVLGKAYQEPHPQAWFGQVTPLVEYKVGNGIIIVSGWRFTVFRSNDEKCKYSDAMTKLHENIMEYLGAAASVDSKDKLPSQWGLIKNRN
ncbi:TPA: DUF4960 domain-containing protein [bacterium]|nr:DUF4960 domain-containing protein [bacterium]